MSPRAVPIEIFLNSSRMIRHKTTISSSGSSFKNGFFKRFTIKDMKELKQKLEILFWGIIDTRKLQSPSTLMAKEPVAITIPTNNSQKTKFSEHFKKQFSPAQKRSIPDTFQGKSESLNNLKIFVAKVLFAGGLVYGSIAVGIWGSTRDTESFVKYLRALLEVGSHEDEIVLQNIQQLDVKEKYNNILKSFIVNIKTAPLSILEMYNKTEQFIKDIKIAKK